MNPLITEAIGSLAAICTAIAFIPQVIKTYRERQMQGLSLGMYLIFTTGVACWFVYGWLLGSWPMIIGNAFTVACTLYILAMKIRYK